MNDENNFDLNIRSILSDAEENVPPLVWEGVSGKLDRLQRKKAVLPLVWRVCAVTGIAAALLCGVFLFSHSFSRKTSRADDTLAKADSIAAVIISQDIPSIQEQIEATAASSAVAKTESPRKARVSASTRPSALSTLPPENEHAAADTPRKVEENGRRDEEMSRQVEETSRQEEWMGWEEENSVRMKEKRFSRKPLLTAMSTLQGRYRQDASGRGMMRAPHHPEASRTGITHENPEFRFSVPVTVGIGIRVPLFPSWSIGSGLQYTFLSRSFIGDYTEMEEDGDIYTVEQTDINNMQHWIGIPLYLYYDFLPKNRWSVHLFAGGSVERLLQNHYLVHTTGNDIHYREKGSGVQWSAGGGIGIAYHVSSKFAIFFDPSIRYYFNNGQPRSIRTIQPLRADFQGGVRFTL